MSEAPSILWLTRDLRLDDNPALQAAIDDGGPVVPLYVAEDADAEGAGAASRWRVGRSLRRLSSSIEALGGRLILRRAADAAAAADCVAALAAELGARRVHVSDCRHPGAMRRAARAATALETRGAALIRHRGRTMLGADDVATGSGGYYRVYTPFSRAAFAALAPTPAGAAPTRWPAPDAAHATWPPSDSVDSLGLETAMDRGGAVVDEFVEIGEAAAQARLEGFLNDDVGRYHQRRDRLDMDGTSRLSAHFAVGELSAGTAWRATRAAMEDDPRIAEGAQVFLKEIVWREFAWHLVAHTPHILERSWRDEWDRFPWKADGDAARRWRQGRTGVDVVDAAMRELYVTGAMHNRARMLTASYLTKHLLTDWRVGEAWFRDCLVDFDPASNAMGWQWAAGSGPDASPFFRIFNPETQAEKFDPEGRYRRAWLPERFSGHGDLFDDDGATPGARFFDAAPRSWTLSAEPGRPEQVISLKDGRERALKAYEAVKKADA